MLTTFKERAVAGTRTVFAELDLLSPLQPPASTRPNVLGPSIQTQPLR